MSASSPPASFTRHLVAFVHVLRRAGLTIGAGEVQAAMQALALVGIRDRAAVRAALRCIFVSRQEQLALFDQAFDLFWRAPSRTNEVLEHLIATSRFHRPAKPAVKKRVRDALIEARAQDKWKQQVRRTVQQESEKVYTYSDLEVLQKKDFAQCSAEELLAAKQLIATLQWPNPTAVSRRRAPHRRGHIVDFRRTLQKTMRTQGEILRVITQNKLHKPRPLTVLCDISGSMDRYSRMLLHFLHSLNAGTHRLEAFVFGTRLTRITAALKTRDIDDAVSEVQKLVEDWSGGTRIGEALKTFNYRWARRVLRSRSIVLIISDGWDRGDVALLRREIARLSRSCHTLLWLNPLLGYADYRPLTAGMRAVLPFVDAHLPVHNLESMQQLVEVISQGCRQTNSIK